MVRQSVRLCKNKNYKCKAVKIISASFYRAKLSISVYCLSVTIHRIAIEDTSSSNTVQCKKYICIIIIIVNDIDVYIGFKIFKTLLNFWE